VGDEHRGSPTEGGGLRFDWGASQTWEVCKMMLLVERRAEFHLPILDLRRA
jgi:hypothetical protein